MHLGRLSLHSEPYGSTGNIGENFRRLLGAPAHGPLQILIREAGQNIADATKLGSGPEVVIRIRALTDAQTAALREQILADLPPEPSSRAGILEFLDRQYPVVMEICDFGTTGLGGPTRADTIPLGTESTDFIDFLRNIGTPRDSVHGGGTYGFGKVALYRASRCGTILVDSLVADGGSGSQRLIGCHIGASFDIPDNEMLRRFTGRHWWGIPDAADGTINPVLDDDARALAEALGFLPRTGGRSGTSIMILDFDLQGEDMEIVGRRAAEALLWNFWPRMMRDTGPERRFKCRVEVQGKPVEVPRPEDFSPLDLFSKAMQAARKGKGNDVRGIASQKPIKQLGNLAIERGLRTQRRHLVSGDSLFPGVCHHIAVMRPVELVVKYLPGAALPDERLEWAGVFIASDEDEVERAFAESEPPAHDDWMPDGLPKGRAKTYVNVALRELKRYAFEMGDVAQGQPAHTSSGPPLARAAGRLGAVLDGSPGDGAGRKRAGRSGSRSRPARARATRPLFVRLEEDAGGRGRVAVFETEVRQDGRRTGMVLQAEPSVVLDGAAAGRVDGIGLRPVVTAIRGPEPRLSGEDGQVAINGAEGRFEICVRFDPESAVTVEAAVLRGSAS